MDRAELQHGLITRVQARRSGLSDSAFDRSVGSGLFLPVGPSVYRVRGVPPNEDMAVMAAVMTARGRVSHATAARRLRIASRGLSPIHVTVDGGARRPRVTSVAIAVEERRRVDVRVHRCAFFTEPSIVVDGIPCVDAERALFDIAIRSTPEQLEAAFERARILGLVTTESLARRFELIGCRGRAGTANIRRLLERVQPNPLESELEIRAWQLLEVAGLPTPVRQLVVPTTRTRHFRIDFAWPDRMVGFETEGFEWHGSRAHWKRDRARIAALEHLGWRIVAATWDDVVRTPDVTVERLRIALAAARTKDVEPR